MFHGDRDLTLVSWSCCSGIRVRSRLCAKRRKTTNRVHSRSDAHSALGLESLACRPSCARPSRNDYEPQELGGQKCCDDLACGVLAPSTNDGRPDGLILATPQCSGVAVAAASNARTWPNCEVDCHCSACGGTAEPMKHLESLTSRPAWMTCLILDEYNPEMHSPARLGQGRRGSAP